MLTDARNAVCSMWEVAENLDKKGIAKILPFIPEGSDLRHTMKGELIFILFKIGGFKKIPNDKQVEFLQYVIHAPIKDDKREEYVKVFEDYERTEFSLLIPFMILIDKEFGSTLSEVYLNFMDTITRLYLSLADEVGLDEATNFYSIMKRNQILVEKGLNKEIEYDALSFIKDEDAKDTMDSICHLYDKMVIKNDEKLNHFIAAFDVIDKKREGSSSDEEKELKDFKDRLNSADEDKADENEKESNDKKNKKSDSFSDVDIIDFDKKKRESSEIKDDLDSLIGLYEVKHQVRSMFNVVQIREECKKRGIVRQPMSYHMVFMGNPGTGKTTVARLIAEAYHDMGLLSKGQLVETSRVDLVAGYVGHTALKVKEVLEKAKGGVLFIDEAYALAGEGNDFGSEAIATLIKGMEDNRDDMVVIVAGYTDLMQGFLDSNPGLKSRFSKTIYFPDYNADELTKIFKKFCHDNNVRANNRVMEDVRNHFMKETAHKKRNYGNARAVRNYFEETLINQANRLVKNETLSDGMICNITLEDLPKRVMINKMNFG